MESPGQVGVKNTGNLGTIGEVRLEPSSGGGGLISLDRRSSQHTFYYRGLYTICGGSGGEGFEWSEKGEIQTEEGRDCGCEDVVRAGDGHAS